MVRILSLLKRHDFLFLNLNISFFFWGGGDNELDVHERLYCQNHMERIVCLQGCKTKFQSR